MTRILKYIVVRISHPRLQGAVRKENIATMLFSDGQSQAQ